MAPKPASGPEVGSDIMNLIWVSVMPWCGSQSAGQSFGSIVNPDVPLYTPSIRPICDAGVWLGCGAPAAAVDGVDPAAVDDGAAVDVLADDDPAVDVLADEVAVDDSAPDGVVAPVVDVALSSLPHAATTRHDAATAPRNVRDILLMASPLGVRRRTPRRTLRLRDAAGRRGARGPWRYVARRGPQAGQELDDRRHHHVGGFEVWGVADAVDD